MTYRKLQVTKVESTLVYLQYIISPGTDIYVTSVNTATGETEFTLTRVATPLQVLAEDQFTVDEDTSCVIVSPLCIGKTLYIVYYTDGKVNPYYASANLHTILAKILDWSTTRIISGLFLAPVACDTEPNLRYEIVKGEFTYNGAYYVYPGEIWDVRAWSPPTTVGYTRGYFLFINEEILADYLDTQRSLLTKVGAIATPSVHKGIGNAYLELQSQYKNVYSSEPLPVAYIYVYLNTQRKYNVWIKYPKEGRSVT